MVGDTEPPVTLLQPAFREHGERCLFSYLDFLTQPWPLGGGCTLASGAGEPLSVKPRRSGAAQALGLTTCRWDGRGGLVADLPPCLIHGSHSPAGAGAPRAPRRVGALRPCTPLGVPVRGNSDCRGIPSGKKLGGRSPRIRVWFSSWRLRGTSQPRFSYPGFGPKRTQGTRDNEKTSERYKRLVFFSLDLCSACLRLTF